MSSPAEALFDDGDGEEEEGVDDEEAVFVIAPQFLFCVNGLAVGDARLKTRRFAGEFAALFLANASRFHFVFW